MDLIERQAAIDAITDENIIRNMDSVMDSEMHRIKRSVHRIIASISLVQPEQQEIGYSECANAMLKMWIDNVLTDGEYSRIMDKLNAYWTERRENG